MQEENEGTKDALEIEESQQEDEAVVEYDIASYPSDFTLDNLYSQWKKGSIVIPEFQREYVWNIRQATLLIDSFMMGLPVPPVFLYLAEDNTYLVIDGQQRLLSTFFFFDGFFGQEKHGKQTVFRLTGLDGSIRYSGKTFADFSADDRRKLEGCVLRAINIRQISPSTKNTSAYHIFERLNTGGTPLKPQEIRNCVFAGDFVVILKELNKDENWRKIIGKPALDKYQKDVELVLRLFSLTETDVDAYEKPMKEFLNRAMDRQKKGNSDAVNEFKEKFPKVCKKVIELLGEKPFHVRGPINSAYLDSVFYTVYRNLHCLSNCLTANYSRLKSNQGFNDEYTRTSTQGTSVLKSRFKMVQTLLFPEPEE